MRRGFSLVISIMVMLAMVWVGFGCAPKAAPEAKYPGWPEKEIYLNYGSTSASSSTYLYAITMAKALNKNVPNLVVTVVETGASVDNMKRLARGEIDFSLSLSDAAYQFYWGVGQFQGEPKQDWLRALWAFSNVGTNYMVRADSSVKTLADLTGRKFNPGMRGSGAESQALQIFEVLGIKPDYYYASTADAVAAIKDNRIVGYAKPGAGAIGTLDASTRDIMTLTPMRALDFGEENANLLKKKISWLSFVKVPANALYKGCPEYWTVNSPVCDWIPKDAPEELVYHMVKAMIEVGHKECAVVYGMVADLATDSIELFAGLSEPIPLHPGAVRYLREQGYEVPDALIPPEMK